MVTEPTSAASQAAWAVAAGATASLLSQLGVTWVIVFWAAAGAFFGAGFAPQTGRMRAMLAFPVSTMLSAKAGIIGAAWLGQVGSISPGDMAQALAALAGILFHPIVAVLVKAAPARLERHLGGQQGNEQGGDK